MLTRWTPLDLCFQFLGIPPKGEPLRDTIRRLDQSASGFQFLGIPPKGEPPNGFNNLPILWEFPIPRDPPEGGTPSIRPASIGRVSTFPIPRDPPEGGTPGYDLDHPHYFVFPIPRDPPEGGTTLRPRRHSSRCSVSNS